MDPLPSLEQAYSMVTQEEENWVSNHRELSGETVVDVIRSSVNLKEDDMEMIETGLGITVKKDENFGQWYCQVIYGLL